MALGRFAYMEEHDGFKVAGNDTATCMRQLQRAVEDLLFEQGLPLHDVILALGMVVHHISLRHPYSEELVALGKRIACVSVQHSREASLQNLVSDLFSGQEEKPPGTGGMVC